jgi:hypothetical protein
MLSDSQSTVMEARWQDKIKILERQRVGGGGERGVTDWEGGENPVFFIRMSRGISCEERFYPS